MTLFPYRYIGKCIYCDSTVPPLTREHILPRGLGGKFAPDGMHEALVLGAASCETCREKTRTFETLCLEHNFGVLRDRKGLRRKDRITDTFAATIIPEDGPKYKAQIKFKETTSIIAMPLLDHAGIVTGRWQSTLTNAKARIIVTHRGKSHTNFPGGVTIELHTYVTCFYRLLAKIAHGFCVARYGLDGFEHTLREMIVGDDLMFGRLIGSDPEKDHDLPEVKKGLHEIKIREVRHPRGRAIVTDIRLFSSYKTPGYYVVTGFLPEAPSGLNPSN